MAIKPTTALVSNNFLLLPHFGMLKVCKNKKVHITEPMERKKTNSKVGKWSTYRMMEFIIEKAIAENTMKAMALYKGVVVGIYK